MTATDYGSYYRGIPHCALREHVIWLSNCVMLNIIKVPSTQWNFSLIIFYLPATNMVADRSSIEGHGLESSAVKDNLPVDLETAAIKAEGELLDHGADTELHRSLGTRHLTMIALGSAIGMGMWLGTGTSLVKGGPASLFIGFLISSSMVWAVSQSIGEMAVMYPVPSAFVQWSTIFISPAAGFALGWGYWFSYWITIANELQVFFFQL